MKAILLPGHAEVRLTERPTPAPGSNEVLVRVQASALCRSDMSLDGGVPVVGGGAAPGTIVPGHEAAGDVVAFGGWSFATWEFPAIVRFIEDHDLPVARLISHRFELGDAAEAFALFQARRTDKVVFVPWTIS